MLDKNLVLVGYSGHGIVVADTALENNFNIIGYAEKILCHFNPYNLEYLGCESDKDFKGWDLHADFLIGIGNNFIREKIYNLINQRGKKIITLISPTASISGHARIGDGVFINKNVSVNAFSCINNNVILNTGCVVEHECEIEDNVHIAPGAVLAGNVKIGANTFVGANAVIKQGLTIGKNVVIGAGTVVLSNIPDGKKIVGNPNRFI